MFEKNVPLCPLSSSPPWKTSRSFYSPWHFLTKMIKKKIGVSASQGYHTVLDTFYHLAWMHLWWLVYAGLGAYTAWCTFAVSLNTILRSLKWGFGRINIQLFLSRGREANKNKGPSTSIWGVHVNLRATVAKKTFSTLNPESQGTNPQQMLKYSRS